MKYELATPAIQLLLALGQFAFLAGGAWMVMRQTRRDVNGLGQKVRRMQALLVRQADTPEKREHAAAVIEGGNGHG